MPPQPLFDVTQIDQSRILADRDGIYKVNPHRFEFQVLDGIYLMDRSAGLVVGYRDCRADEFWVRAHIPGRPIFPGVLMIEAAAQLVSYYVMSAHPERGFLGFGGVTDVKFRGSVVPGKRVILVGRLLDERPRRCIGATQGFVDGQMVYEGTITGMWI
ncbi:MAG: 3-hydroxyacyl-ACP dehydratase FabZ family protein [Phycisphaerae bacterium]